MFEEIMLKTSNLIKDMNQHIQEAQQIPNYTK